MRFLLVTLFSFLLMGCSARKIALNMIADSFGAGNSFQTESDPQLAGEALPFGLKLMESIVQDVKDNPGLYASLSQGFLLYAYGYIEPNAERIKETDFDEYQRQRKRAKEIYQRSHHYAILGLLAASRDFGRFYPKDPAKALAALKANQASLLYAAGASLAKWSTIEKLDPEAIGQLGRAVSFIERGLALDSNYDNGSFQEFMAVYEGRPAAMGGNRNRAMAHYQEALKQSEGKKVSIYMTYVETFALPNQDRKAFRANLEKILAFDLESCPQYRLTNALVQIKAKNMLQRESELFIEEEP